MSIDLDLYNKRRGFAEKNSLSDSVFEVTRAQEQTRQVEPPSPTKMPTPPAPPPKNPKKSVRRSVEVVNKPVMDAKQRKTQLDAKSRLYTYKPSSEERRYYQHQQRLFNNLYFA